MANKRRKYRGVVRHTFLLLGATLMVCEAAWGHAVVHITLLTTRCAVNNQHNPAIFSSWSNSRCRISFSRISFSPPPLQRRKTAPSENIVKALTISGSRQPLGQPFLLVLTVERGAKGALKPRRPPVVGWCPEAVRRCRLLQPLCHERRR